MRVVAGALGGRRLRAPSGRDTRPTSDRVREALFAALGAHVGDARVLDLFAGSGALGIEALSRGAGHVSFVDASRAAMAAVRANLDALGVDVATVALRRVDARAALRAARAAGDQYDLVFLDPPYRHADRFAPVLSDAIPGLLAADGRVVVESDRRAPLALDLPLLDERRYGDTLIRIHGT